MRLKLIEVANWLSLVFAIFLIITSLTFAYVLLTPLDVLKDWKITVDNKVYYPKDEITMHIEYTKVRSVTGKTDYYLECLNTNNRIIRYPIAQVVGNRPAGSGKTDVTLTLPSDVTYLPTTCRLAVAIDYRIYAFRSFLETNTTNEFRLESR